MNLKKVQQVKEGPEEHEPSKPVTGERVLIGNGTRSICYRWEKKKGSKGRR